MVGKISNIKYLYETSYGIQVKITSKGRIRFVNEADIIPDTVNKQLRVKVHADSRPGVNKSLQRLFEKLNEAEIIYPGTDLKL